MQLTLWNGTPRADRQASVLAATVARVPTSIELFAGGGGMALGLHLAGFDHLRLIEWDTKACETLLLNAMKPEAPWAYDSVQCMDVRDYVKELRETSPNSVDVLAGGPPCQPFSLGGIHAGDADERNMFPAALEVVRLTRPRAVVFENVPGLLRPSFISYFDYVAEQLAEPTVDPKADESWRDHRERVRRAAKDDRDLRYRVKRQVIVAADFGVPQLRRRVFLVALRSDHDASWNDLEGDHSQDALLYDQWVDGAYWDEHSEDREVKRLRSSGALVAPSNLTTTIARLRAEGRPSTKRWRTIRDALREPEPLPVPLDGRQRGRAPNHVGIMGARSYRGHTGSDIDLPSKTIKAGVHGVCGGEAMIRFRDGHLRYMTVRESARMQSFPDWYELVGARSHAMRLIGNAVAVTVGRAIGEKLRTLTGVV